MTRSLHLVQAGIDNGDKKWIEEAAKRGLRSAPVWVVPKSANVGDDVVIYIGGLGFFATGRVGSTPKLRRNWANRYGAALESLRLITPPISLATIRRHIPDLTWAIYPRSITTPSPRIATQVHSLVSQRRRTGLPDLTVEALEEANIEELRQVALLRSTRSVSARATVRLNRVRSHAIRLYVLRRAAGSCEWCEVDAPFVTSDGSAYLEPHHVTRLADGGPDHPAKVIGLCPNCHRRAHYAADAKKFNEGLIKKLRSIETTG